MPYMVNAHNGHALTPSFSGEWIFVMADGLGFQGRLCYFSFTYC